MIDKDALRRFVDDYLASTPFFTVDVTVSPQNDITVEIDGTQGVDIDFCVALSRAIEKAFPRDDDDYQLEVGSAGLTAPFKVIAQYEKNVGNNIELLTGDGRKLKATLAEVTEQGINISYEVKTRIEGQKKPVMKATVEYLPFDNIKKAQLMLDI